MTAPPTHPVDVLLILVRGDQVLLALRQGTGYADGEWNLPSGKLEVGEDAISAVIREAAEEIGIHLDQDEPRLVTTVHHQNWTGLGRIGLVFAVDHAPARHGHPTNAEPHKCAKLEWFPADTLPTNTYPYTAASIQAYRTGEHLMVSGWRETPPP
ncbi:NUDIX hydrolase [Phytohabitans houttuyneae]|uniref:NUDIX hydrolase n=1 Tax=Phytohabitans houttuyneae TaxID=1076126 RepID=UPI001C49AC1D|nr:NUDIX domain-containing protein [Phytohabitans houttuyneae]